jgi:hypothetical protein
MGLVKFIQEKLLVNVYVFKSNPPNSSLGIKGALISSCRNIEELLEEVELPSETDVVTVSEFEELTSM